MKADKYLRRCQDCCALVEGENGEWMCDELEKPCREIEHCPEGAQLDDKNPD